MITTTIAAALTVGAIAQGHASTNVDPAPAAAPEITELVGQGSDVCPDMSLCLYENLELNKSKAARVWVFPITDARTDYPLHGHAAEDKPSSGYLRSPKYGWVAYLFPASKCGFDGEREAEGLSFVPNTPYDSLNGHSGRAKRYGYFNYKGKWTKQKQWGITSQGLNLNDRAGCIAVGSFNNTDDLRPTETGDM